MTVTYTHEVATGKGFGNFWRLLGRWRGSIYKVVVPELLVYSVIFGAISLIYRFYVKQDDGRKQAFDKWARYCGDYAGVIPVSFVLGFYVSQIVTRWWNQFMSIPWPDPIALLIASTLHGNDDDSRIMKRTIMRYVNLSFVMTMVMISPQAKARFPTIEHLVDAGLMFPHEKEVFDRLNSRSDLPKYWIPLVWAGNIASKARRENRIKEDLSLINILAAIAKFRGGCGELLAYDWVCIPLVYTQVVTLAVYLYFLAALFGKQFIDDEHDLDLYIPIFLFLEFFFYTGWLKVAETMVNPFGEDDDDFEVNWLIDRDITISFMIVDDIQESFPELTKDQWWDEIFPTELPYTVAAQKFKVEVYEGSAALQNVSLGGSETLFVLPDKKNKDVEASLSGLPSSPTGDNKQTTSTHFKNEQLSDDISSVSSVAPPPPQKFGSPMQRK